MIQVKNLCIETHKGRKLIKDLSFALNEGDKLAIIGEEGNGKSTLLKAILDSPDVESYVHVSGEIFKGKNVIGYLEQKLDSSWNNSNVLDFFLKSTPHGEVNYEIYNKLHVIEQFFKIFEIDLNLLDRGIIGNLSGGEQVKIQIVKILVNEPDVLFLDEPTNDLDIETLIWLEDFILKTQKPIMFISHDETLLENAANRILHIEQLKRKTEPHHTLSGLSYNDYIQSRKDNIEKQTQMAYSEKREMEKKERILREMKQKVESALNSSKKDPSQGRILAKKMANVKALEARYDKTELTQIPDVEEAIKLIIDKEITIPKPKRILDISVDKLEVPGKFLSKDINLSLFGPKKVAIVGRNGAGKTTLLRLIYQKISEISGLNVGYFSQNYREVLDYNKTPVETLSFSKTGLNSRTALGCMKFTQEEMEHRIEDLSEGQKAKVLLMKLILDKNNVLVMDEPTRNLSPLSNPVFRGILREYSGAVITVSHDRKFIGEICDDAYYLDSEGLRKVADFSELGIKKNDSNESQR